MNHLVKIGVFYDGNYFAHVSNYYNYIHPRKARISISGLHDFVRKMVADYEKVDICQSQIVDAHYFRGRYLAIESQKSNKLMAERQFDDILMTSGIVTHYLPITARGEKGLDVWFSLEALELSMYKKFDVVVLIACDSDYVPLARKLNTLGIRVMVLSWEFEYIDPQGRQMVTTTSQQLLNEVSYPVFMQSIIEERLATDDPFMDALFVKKSTSKEDPFIEEDFDKDDPGVKNTVLESDQDYIGNVQAVKEGYGFIKPENNSPNVFFYYGEVEEGDFNELKIGDKVKYKLGRNDRGLCGLQVRLIASTDYSYY
ncbi:MAG: NYN domain-containing protein [Salinivirgaceae bacterium]|nr:NYN domain-containing protein [Salinivirgaceae bacterium]